MTNNLQGKKILMFSPHVVTQHYCDTIIRELQRRGAHVVDYDERPSQGTIGKTIIRYFGRFFSHYFTNYIKRIIQENKNNNFDYILVIKGEAFTPQVIKILRTTYPKAIFILYMWDLLSVRKINDIIPLFDRALTFDINDSKSSNKLIFRPTFCADAYEKIKTEFTQNDIDVLFIGTLHTNRYKILNHIKESFLRHGITSQFLYYVPAFIVYLKNKTSEKEYASLKEVRFKPYSVDETINLVQNSKAILDLRYNDNENLSMRAFEAMISKRKYITNNPSIKKYDFYDPQNILLISEHTPVVSKTFFQTPFRDIPDNILNKYKIQTWINDVFFNNQQLFIRK